jgi:hypothetical protein
VGSVKAETVELVRELNGATCRCGSRKVLGHTFCRECYSQLPSETRLGLLRELGAGYEQAYARAAALLDERRMRSEATR